MWIYRPFSYHAILWPLASLQASKRKLRSTTYPLGETSFHLNHFIYCCKRSRMLQVPLPWLMEKQRWNRTFQGIKESARPMQLFGLSLFQASSSIFMSLSRRARPWPILPPLTILPAITPPPSQIHTSMPVDHVSWIHPLSVLLIYIIRT